MIDVQVKGKGAALLFLIAILNNRNDINRTSGFLYQPSNLEHIQWDF
jgi:hypothetical protein